MNYLLVCWLLLYEKIHPVMGVNFSPLTAHRTYQVVRGREYIFVTKNAFSCLPPKKRGLPKKVCFLLLYCPRVIYPRGLYLMRTHSRPRKTGMT